ncbi:MAG: thiamine phosphate synthase, partial [Steroidobacteraceae bacterium]
CSPDYVALGPIYPTLLKQMPWAPQGLTRLGEWKRRLGGIALVAIGGLTVERLAGVFAAGADSAAVVTDIVRHPQPEQRVRAWLLAAAGPDAATAAAPPG